VDHPNKLRTLSLCSGFSGIERGIELAGTELRTLAHVEIEAFAIANLVAKMEAGSMAPSPIWTDLKTLPLEPFRGAVDILTGGYPCQPFSVAGKRLGKEDPRHLWPWICRIIDGIMPRMCFFENVEGHVTNGLRQVLADLEARGYSCTWGIFSAEECGAPHRRKRMFILAHSFSGGVCRRWSSEERGDDTKRIQGNEGERDELRCETERLSASSLQPMAHAHAHGEGRDRNSEPSGYEAPLSEPALSSSHGWPARPGQEPFEWEESRIKPKVGRTTDGTDNRIDELRMLGNGVVPQTAARAWVTLSEELGL